MTHRFFLKLWAEMRLGAMVTTRKQNKHQATGKLLILQNQRRPDRFNQMLRSYWLVFFNANGIVHKEFVPPGQTVNQFYLQVLKRLRDSVRKKTTRNVEQQWLVHLPRQCPCPHGLKFAAVSGKKRHDGYPCTMWLFPVPSYETPDERETFCWCQQSEKENSGGLEQHKHWRVPKCFQQWVKRWYKCIKSKGEYFEGDLSCNSLKPNKPFKKNNSGYFWVPPRITRQCYGNGLKSHL